MEKIIVILFCTSLLVQLPSQAWLFPKEKVFLDEISVRLPGSLISSSTKLPIKEKAAKTQGWKKTDDEKCGDNEIYRGNRYRYDEEYGTMLLFDSSGRISGIQTAVPTSVEMAEKRKYMMPVANGRYHLTIYFKDPNEICNTQHRGDRKGGKKFLIQTGASWKSTMNIPISETELESTLWVEGNAVPFMGTFYWYNISKAMDCERTFPIYLLYSDGKLDSFGWTFKGYFNDPKFDHPSPSYASIAFEKETFPDCIKNAKKKGSTQHIYLRQRNPFFG